MLEDIAKQNKVKEITTLIFAITLLVFDSFIYINNGIMLQNSNRDEKQYINSIVSEIKKYEKESKTQITKVAIYYDSKSQKTFNNYKNNTFTIKALHTIYADVDSISYYLGHRLEKINKDDNIAKYFEKNEWKQFEKEQLIFKDDILHLCVY